MTCWFATAVVLFLSGCSETPSPAAPTNSGTNTPKSSPVFDIAPPEALTVVRLHFNAEWDLFRRPRVHLDYPDGRTVSAMFDTGSDRSVFAINVPGKTVASSTHQRRIRFVSDEFTRKASKIIREKVNITDALPRIDGITLDVHLVEGSDLGGEALMGAMPLADFTRSVGGVFGYLPDNNWDSKPSPRGWLMIGGPDKSFNEFCDPAGVRTGQLPLRTATRFGRLFLDWVVDGSLAVGDYSQKVKWVIDTGGLPWFEISSEMFSHLVEGLERNGKSKVVRDMKTGFFVLTNCADAKDDLPELEISIGSGSPKISFLLKPKWSLDNQTLFYMGLEMDDGTCNLVVTVVDSRDLLFSTHLLDQLFTVFNARDRHMSFCERNVGRAKQLAKQ